VRTDAIGIIALSSFTFDLFLEACERGIDRVLELLVSAVVEVANEAVDRLQSYSAAKADTDRQNIVRSLR
jgi:hypothetical protein